MSPRIWLSGIVIVCAAASTVSAQSLLERLEQRLQQETEVPQDVTPTEETLPAPRPAETERESGYFGFAAEDIGGGVEIATVHAGGPAAEAGLRPGDRIVSAGGVPLKSVDELVEILANIPAGSGMEFVLERAGREREVTLVAAAREPDVGREPMEEEFGPPPRLGLRALPVTADLQRRYGLVVRSGAVIESIDAGSPAARARLPIGGVIVAVDGQRVDTPADLADAIAAARPGDTVNVTYYRGRDVLRQDVRLGGGEGAVDTARVPADRPLLRRLERALDDVVPREGAPRNVLPRAQGGEVEQLRQELLRLREEVERLQERVGELEAATGKGAVRTDPEGEEREVELTTPMPKLP